MYTYHKRLFFFTFLVLLFFSTNVIHAKDGTNKDTVYVKCVRSLVREKANTYYIISKNINLRKKQVVIGPDCAIEFNGGYIANGVIIGNNTRVYFGRSTAIGKNVVLKGSYEVRNIPQTAFLIYDEQTLINIMQLAQGKEKTYVKVPKTDIAIKGFINSDIDYEKTDFSIALANTIIIPSNIHIDFSGSKLVITPNERILYSGLGVIDSKNVVIENCNIEGDARTHKNGEHGHGYWIAGSENVTIRNCTASLCSGDGFMIGQLSNNSLSLFKASNNILIDSCKSEYNRRQGLSIVYANNVTIKNSEFNYTGYYNGTLPMAGIDLEPNNWPQIIDILDGRCITNVSIDNCNFVGNNGRDIDMLAYSKNPTIHNISISRSNLNGTIRITNAEEILIDSCCLKTIILTCGNTDIINNSIDGCLYLDGAPRDVRIFNNEIVTDFDKLQSPYMMGVGIVNKKEVDMSGVVIGKNTFTARNFNHQDTYYQVRPICRIENPWVEWQISGFPLLLNNVFKSEDLPIFLHLGNEAKGNVVEKMSNLNIIKGKSVFEIVDNKFISYSNKIRLQMSRKGNDVYFVRNSFYRKDTMSNHVKKMFNKANKVLLNRVNFVYGCDVTE